MKLFSRICLYLLGWKMTGSMPEGLKKAVLIVAPHTSAWDFIIGRMAYYQLGVNNIHFLIKKEMFRFPLGIIIRSLGAIPIDRGKNNKTIMVANKMFEERENLFLLLTPEGTRRYNEHWKKGFYHIAVAANVPIVLCYIDYYKKEGGIGPILYPTGNFDEDFRIITGFYKTKTAKYPERFNLTPSSN